MLHSRVYDILPPPFAWIVIPAGKVTLEAGGYVPEGGQTFDMPAFEIAKYPVTNAQFARFIATEGYTQKKWWTDAGWEAKVQGIDWDSEEASFVATGKPWTNPRFWGDENWNGADYPVVGVSWYEALAFCRWLSETCGENITLPADQQRQRAAQGDDGRLYPWGNEWDCSCCHNSVSPCESKYTAEVTQYEGKGDSPYGVVDMAGNVWEWCLSSYKTGKLTLDGTDRPSLSGGSWGNELSEFFRVILRGSQGPQNTGYSIGFRIART